MDPTLEDGEIGLMNVFSAKFQDIERFDVVVVYNEEKKENWVKRVIGLPGDTIYAKDDVVYVNGMPIEEPYLDNDYADSIRLTENYKFTEDFDELQLGEDEYYLMGDNRYASKDSREMGAFKRGDIKAVDFFISVGFIPHKTFLLQPSNKGRNCVIMRFWFIIAHLPGWISFQSGRFCK